MSFIKNKKALFNYEVLEKYEAGISLYGFEVKAVKRADGSLAGSFVKIRNEQAYLVNAYIAPYQPANTPKEYDPYRERRLLLSKKELKYLAGKEREKGLTLVPVSMYNRGRKIKLEMVLAKGKKKHDKRQDIKKRDMEREISREFKEKLK